MFKNLKTKRSWEVEAAIRSMRKPLDLSLVVANEKKGRNKKKKFLTRPNQRF